MLSILSIESLFYSTSREAQRDKKTGVYEILKKYLPIVNKSSLSLSSSNSTLNNTQTRVPVININNAYSNMKKDNSSTIMSDHLAKVNLLHEYINFWCSATVVILNFFIQFNVIIDHKLIKSHIEFFNDCLFSFLLYLRILLSLVCTGLVLLIR